MLANHLLLMVAAFLAGAVNSVAGGGTLLTFPVLIAALTPQFGAAHAAVIANATSTVALFPGSLASVAAYRKELAATRSWAMILLVPSLVGGGLGAWLLTALPATTFAVLVPWLILSAAVLFAAQPFIARRMQIGKQHAPAHSGAQFGAMCFQFAVAIYGGYFGAGIGILMLSALAMMGLTDIHEMNALKTVLGSAINGVAVVIFVVQHQVHWPFAILMAIAAIAGGYLGARLARTLDRNFVRRVVIAIGFSLAAYYFYRQITEKTHAAAREPVASAAGAYDDWVPLLACPAMFGAMN